MRFSILLRRVIALTAVLSVVFYGMCFLKPVAAAKKAESEHQVWFTPNMGTEDMLELFTLPDLWASTRAKTDVFKFYTGQVANMGQSCKGTVRCGRNYLENLVDVHAFSKLKQWGIDIAIESLYPFPVRPSGKSFECASGKWAVDFAVEISKELIRNVQSNGGIVRYLAMDEPVRKWYPQAYGSTHKEKKCLYDNLGKLADDVAQYIKQMKSSYPSVRIGQIELYPEVGVKQLKNWIIELENRGITLPFLHLDVHKRRIRDYRKLGINIDTAEDLRSMKSFLKAHNTALGVIFTDIQWQNYYPDKYNDKVYYDNTIEWIRFVKKAIGEPDHSIFQSWVLSYSKRYYQKISKKERRIESKKRSQMIPFNLPENDSSSHSHTRLINDSLSILRNNP